MIKKTGFTLVEIMIVVAIVALLTSVVAPNVYRARKSAHEANALKFARTLSDSFELYQADKGFYPMSISSLTDTVPPYLSSSSFTETGIYSSTGSPYYAIHGTTYSFACTFFNLGSFGCNVRDPKYASFSMSQFQAGEEFKAFRFNAGGKIIHETLTGTN